MLLLVSEKANEGGRSAFIAVLVVAAIALIAVYVSGRD